MHSGTVLRISGDGSGKTILFENRFSENRPGDPRTVPISYKPFPETVGVSVGVGASVSVEAGVSTGASPAPISVTSI